MKQTALLMAVAAATMLGCNQKADTAVPDDATKAATDAEVPEADADEDAGADAEADAEPASDMEDPTDDEAAEEEEAAE